jgi:hypothetical protein
MGFVRILFISCILCLAVNPSNAQNIDVGGVFPTIDHSGTLNSKLDYSLYYFGSFPLVNFNTSTTSKDAYFHQFYAEHALTYKQSENLSFTGSYVYQRTNVFTSNYVNENRFYLQAKLKNKFAKFTLSHRLRFDGRFIQNRVTNTYPFAHRVRYQLGLETPINGKLYFTAYEEVFFNTFKGASPVYGENWFYAALGRKINERNKIEAGLLYVTWNIGNKNWFNQYYLQFTWINHLDFRKKKTTP